MPEPGREACGPTFRASSSASRYVGADLRTARRLQRNSLGCRCTGTYLDSVRVGRGLSTSCLLCDLVRRLADVFADVFKREFFSARRETRTLTFLQITAFKAVASTDSAIRALLYCISFQQH